MTSIYEWKKDGVLGSLVTRSEGPNDSGEVFRQAVVGHGLAGLAIRAAESGRLKLSPRDEVFFCERWKAARRKSALVNLEARRLSRVALEASRSNEIKPPILFKGESVARRYADPSVRCYNDIDLLVSAEDAGWWSAQLNRLGYRTQNRWRERNSLEYDKHAEYRCCVADAVLLCDLHLRLSISEDLRVTSYETFEGWGEPGATPGFLELKNPAQLVALAVHLAQHSRRRRRLIWYQDFLELGNPPDVDAARKLAERIGLSETLEWALGTVEEWVGQEIWGAVKLERPPGNLADAAEADLTGLRFHFALAKQMGFARGLRYVLSKFDPRRFADSRGRYLRFRSRS